LTRYRADWILPIDRPPIAHGWIEVSNDRVVAVGEGAVAGAEDLGRVAILPGLVNAHTHLELSHLHRRVPAAAEFVEWIRGVVASRRQYPDPRDRVIVEATAAGIKAAVGAGTALVGDISNTLITPELLGRARLDGVVFYELIRFNPSDAAALIADARAAIDGIEPSHTVRVSLAAHAPYSVAPSVFRAMAADAAARTVPVSVHLAESRAESQFVSEGRGPWREFLHDVGAWNPDWTAAGVTPTQYLDGLGFLGPRVLAVHGVQMNDTDLAILRERGATLVTCPRSNEHTGAGSPPVAAFYGSGVRVAIGTDSLASTDDLNVFSELAALRRLAPGVPAARLLHSATRAGAEALGFADEYGTISSGKRARLLAAALPDVLTDVEEYLVGGLEPDQVRWVDAI
jgi:cytosine/adenosine deaminase-related metal-dependent hydrolase